jgi:NitT/TauT family transport system substrate-binding protein
MIVPGRRWLRRSCAVRQLRDDYRASIVSSYDPEDKTAATETCALLARYGGAGLVGDQTALAPGTFWEGYRK